MNKPFPTEGSSCQPAKLLLASLIAAFTLFFFGLRAVVLTGENTVQRERRPDFAIVVDAMASSLFRRLRPIEVSLQSTMHLNRCADRFAGTGDDAQDIGHQHALALACLCRSPVGGFAFAQ